MVDIILAQNQAASGNSTNLSSGTLTTDFNISPYNDDYDPNAQYYRILYKPGYAVQARELTQIQSMLQSQISRFGSHIFKEGSIVLPGAFTIRSAVAASIDGGPGNPIDYVKIKDVDSSNNKVDVSSLINLVVTGQTNNISAYVVDVLDRDGTTANTKTLYVNYLGAGQANASIKVFAPNETLVAPNVGTCTVLSTDPVANTGKSAWFQIEEGVFYAKQHFIFFPTQSVVLDRYNSEPTCKVGFYVSEQIVSSEDDISLLDPALESSNYAAPGADRLKLVSKLTVLSITDNAGVPDFVTLFTIKDGIIQTLHEKTEYNVLGDVLAGRTNEESGDYVVKGMNVQLSEHDNISTPVQNYGRYANGNSSLLLVSVDPGSAYVKGYSVVKYDKTDVEIPKPTRYDNVATQLSSTTMGSYLTVEEIVGTWRLDQGTRIGLWDAPQKRVSTQKWSIGAQTGTLIGNATLNSVEYQQGIPGYNAIYNIYLSDITMLGNNPFANVRSLFLQTSPYPDLGADILGAGVATSNTFLQESNKSTLLYYVGANAIKTIRDRYGASKTTYYFYKTDGVTSGLYFDTAGLSTITLSGPVNQQLPYGTTTLNGLTDIRVLNDITIACANSMNIGPLFGGAVSTGSGSTLTGAGTFFTRLNVGDKIEISGKTNTMYIASIANNTSLTTTVALPTGLTGNTIFKAYKAGDIINMAGVGVNAGVQRTVGTTPTSLTFDLKESFPGNMDCTITYKIGTTSSLEATKTLNPNRFVKISCANTTIGPFCLGFSDVLSVNKIVLKDGSAPTTLSDGTDVTQYFTLNNGQKDLAYDLAFLNKSRSLPLTATNWLLVSLNYFSPTFSGRTGYFSVDSYPVQDNDALSSNSTIRTEQIPVYSSPTSGFQYDLRNYFDYRPVKQITAADAISIGAASNNPANVSAGYIFSASGMMLPAPSSQLSYDYSYYLGRTDVVTINKDGIVSVTTGEPSRNPIVPNPPETQMILSLVKIPPYPSLSPAYGNSIQRKDLSCVVKKTSNRVYTMRDIGVLDKRITSMEYYAALTLLEKDALNLKILDANGIDRFKNGIFVDTFRDTTLSAKGVDRDFRIVVDPLEMSIRPLFSTNSVGYNYISGSGVTYHSNKIITLNYSPLVQFNLPHVTDTRELERGTFFFQGKMTLLPAQDVWVDTSFAPDEMVSISVSDALIDINVFGPNAVNQNAELTKSLINTEWESWKSTITGYNLYRGSGEYVGFYSTAAEAQQAASSWTTSQGGGTATMEALYNNTRIGTNYFSNTSADTGAGGAKLIASDIIPYIRPQKIAIMSLNLKGYSKMSCFFDGTNMTAYCTPLSVTQYNQYVAGQPVSPGANGQLPQEGASLIVDDFGGLYFTLRLPADSPRFRTGQRKIIIIDNTNINAQTIADTADTSTSATAMFFAQGTSQTLQRTIYSTKGYITTTEPTSQSYDSNSFQTLPNTWTPPPKGHCCFDPDAKVLMADYTWKAIKDIVEGDEVIGNNHTVNKVIKNKTIEVGTRKMLKLKGSNFYTTDDHIFLTKKGWKTWDPLAVLKDKDTSNDELLVGESKFTGINDDDFLKTVVVDGNNNVFENFVSYADVEAEVVDFDPDFIVHDLTLDGNMSYVVEGYVVHNCCIAYSVLIRAPDDEEGIFCTGFDIYIARKSRTRGIWFELGEMSKTGQVTDSRIPGSQIWYNNSQISVSETGGDNPMQVRFDAPVFLFNKKSYAFIVHSDSPNPYDVDPDTQIWISRLGQVDKLTGDNVNDRQGTGQFWQTTNNVNWYEVGDIDLKMTIYRANFVTGVGSAVIGNKPIERLLLANLTSSISNKLGEHFSSGDTLTLAGANGSISIGNRLRGNTSGANANGIITLSPSANRYLISNTGYMIGESVSEYNLAGTYTGISAIVSAVSNATAILSYVDESSANIYSEWIQSTGGFYQNNTIKLLSNGGNSFQANVTNIADYDYSVVSFEPKVLDFIKTDISYEMDTYDDIGALTPSGYTQIFASETYYFDTEKTLMSKSNEIRNIAGNYSNKVRVTMSTISPYVSPVLDLETTHTIYIHNIINANTTGENQASGGQATNKYISQTVTLADGQDAEDFKVYVTGYRPPATDIIVYAKFLHDTDGEALRQKNWIMLAKDDDGDSLYSSLASRNNWKEFTYSIPNALKTGPRGEFQYVLNSITYTGFKYFAIKILLVSTNSAIVPRCADLRCLAMQI